jgi:hypothetical protein
MLRNAQNVGSLHWRELVDDDDVEGGAGIYFSVRARSRVTMSARLSQTDGMVLGWYLGTWSVALACEGEHDLH